MLTETKTYHLKIDAAGRVVLPAEVRLRHHMTSNASLVITDDGVDIRIRTQAEALAAIQAYFATLAPNDVLLSEELLNDRRKEARLEQLRP